MALKEKTPTPTNIVEQIQNQAPEAPPSIPKPPSQPQVDSSKNSIKFSPEEIDQIQKLQQEMNQVIYQLGQLKMNEIKLEKSRGILESKLNEIEKKETDLAGTLNKKYGRGTLDIDSGEFIPSK